MESMQSWDALTATIAQVPRDAPNAHEVASALLVGLGLLRPQASARVENAFALERRREITGPSFSARVAARLWADDAGTARAAAEDPSGRAAAFDARRFLAGARARHCGQCNALGEALWRRGQCSRCGAAREALARTATVQRCETCHGFEPLGARYCERCGSGLGARPAQRAESLEQLERHITHVSSFPDDYLLWQRHHDVVELVESFGAHDAMATVKLIPLAERLLDQAARRGAAVLMARLGLARVWRLRRALMTLEDHVQAHPLRTLADFDGPRRVRSLRATLDDAPPLCALDDVDAALTAALETLRASLAKKQSMHWGDDSMHDELDAQARANALAQHELARPREPGTTPWSWLAQLDARLAQQGARETRGAVRAMLDFVVSDPVGAMV